MASEQANGEDSSQGKEHHPSTLSSFKNPAGSAKLLEKPQRFILALYSSFVELARPGNTISQRSLKYVLYTQLFLIGLLTVGLITVHVEISVLQDAATAPLAKGGQKEIVRRLCKDSSLAKELHDKFKGTVLIINTNYESAARSTSSFLRAVYGRFFDNIVIVSEKDIPELGVEARGQKLWRGQWYFAFWHLPKIMSDYPDAEGFLWTNDDVAINYWHLLKGNMSKLWLTNDKNHPESRYFPFDSNTKAKWSDWAAEETCRKKAREAYGAMDEKYREQFDRSVEPFTGTYPKRICDLFFIPRRFVKGLSFDLIPIFREYKLWSEVAVPMMFYALDDPSDWDHVLDDMTYSWGHWDQKKVFNPTEHWTTNISAFHPWKLSNPTLRTQLIMAFSVKDPCILQILQEPFVTQK